MEQKPFLATVIIFLLATTIFFGYQFFTSQSNASAIKNYQAIIEKNSKVADFMKLVINKVLRTNKGVNFDERLQLENGVRTLNDPNLLLLWQDFVASQNENEAQTKLENLLESLVNKIHG